MSSFGDLSGSDNPGGLDVDRLLSNLQEFQGAAARSAQRMAIETADGWSKDELVHVWVNAQGVVVQVEFDETLLAQASGAEAGAAVVEAAQAAAAQMRAKTDAFQAGLWQQVAQFGVPTLTEVEELKPLQPEVPLSAPGSRERRTLAEELETSDDPAHADPQDWQLTIHDKD